MITAILFSFRRGKRTKIHYVMEKESLTDASSFKNAVIGKQNDSPKQQEIPPCR